MTSQNFYDVMNDLSLICSYGMYLVALNRLLYIFIARLYAPSHAVSMSINQRSPRYLFNLPEVLGDGPKFDSFTLNFKLLVMRRTLRSIMMDISNLDEIRDRWWSCIPWGLPCIHNPKKAQMLGCCKDGKWPHLCVARCIIGVRSRATTCVHFCVFP